MSRVWKRVKYGEDVDRPLAPRHRPDGHEIPSGKHTKSIKKLLKIAIEIVSCPIKHGKFQYFSIVM